MKRPLHRYNAVRYSLCVFTLFALAACSKTPKQQALESYYEGCYSVKLAAVKRYCECMVNRLDAAIPTQAFNNPDADPMRLLRAMGQTAEELAPICKRETER